MALQKHKARKLRATQTPRSSVEVPLDEVPQRMVWGLDRTPDRSVWPSNALDGSYSVDLPTREYDRGRGRVAKVVGDVVVQRPVSRERRLPGFWLPYDPCFHDGGYWYVPESLPSHHSEECLEAVDPISSVHGLRSITTSWPPEDSLQEEVELGHMKRLPTWYPSEAGFDENEEIPQMPATPRIPNLPSPDLPPVSTHHRFCACCQDIPDQVDEARYLTSRSKMDSQRE